MQGREALKHSLALALPSQPTPATLPIPPYAHCAVGIQVIFQIKLLQLAYSKGGGLSPTTMDNLKVENDFWTPTCGTVKLPM